MEYRGVRFTIEVGIEREQLYVVIHTARKSLQTIIFGTREDANIKARSMIDGWLRKRRRIERSQQLHLIGLLVDAAGAACRAQTDPGRVIWI